MASYSEEKLTALQADSGIIRNRLKIRAAVVNAQVFQKIQQEWGSFDRYLWHWTGETCLKILQNQHFKQHMVIVDRSAPFLVMVSQISGISRVYPMASDFSICPLHSLLRLQEKK